MRRQRFVMGVVALATLSALGTLAVPGSSPAATHPSTYYVSLGDSYSVGYQPVLGATPGYTVYVARHTGLTLVNFGCAGATTSSLLETVGCPAVLPHTAGAMAYPTTTQIAAAEAFLALHRGHIGLITVTIGGNDVTHCAAVGNARSCVQGATSGMEANVTTLAHDLRHAVGPRVPIIGLTYPDVFLGADVFPTHPPSPRALTVATASVTAFKTLINPALVRAYASAGGRFVDVTRATGAYLSWGRHVTTAAYGSIPAPVALSCSFTWFCARGDIHPKTAGYRLTGQLVVTRYRALTRVH